MQSEYYERPLTQALEKNIISIYIMNVYQLSSLDLIHRYLFSTPKANLKYKTKNR